MIAVEYRQESVYPYQPPFHPAQAYPEYLWPEAPLADKTNDVYDMVRNLFVRLAFDADNFGLASWNPLGHLVQPGMTVLLKPNMVLSWHPMRPGDSLDSLITHPSLVRAVMDYVAIALRGKGRIIVGDAPLQSCDFKKLLSTQGYEAIGEFYSAQGISVSFVDFRQIASVYNEHHILETTSINGDPSGYKIVDMKDYSAHRPVRGRSGRFRVTNYDHKEMAVYHTTTFDKYLIAATPLSADVVISLPKLKVHRKAGMTGALKNFVGIIGHKDCLPHHTRNSVDEGGDEYLQRNAWKRHAVSFTEWMNVCSIKGYGSLARIMRYASSLCLRRAARLGTDPFAEGSWYGNDTIWRTTHDLVRIITYADKEGVLRDEPQRRVFAIADAIIAGEGEGPLEPTPRHAGFLAAGEDLPALDYTMTILMGLEPQCIPTVREAFAEHPLPLTKIQPVDVEVHANTPAWDKADLKNLPVEKSLRFIPPAHWQGHVERRG